MLRRTVTRERAAIAAAACSASLPASAARRSRVAGGGGLTARRAHDPRLPLFVSRYIRPPPAAMNSRPEQQPRRDDAPVPVHRLGDQRHADDDHHQGEHQRRRAMRLLAGFIFD